MKPINVDDFLQMGCGRCKLGNTPNCKAIKWGNVLSQLRKIVLQSELKEEVKWSIPCYTFQNKNILSIAAFKEYCVISFFKGALLKDTSNSLSAPGENSQAFRYLKFTNAKEIKSKSKIILDLIQQAIAIEKDGKKIKFKPVSEFNIPPELEKLFTEKPSLKKSFNQLSPGRQKGYLLYFSQAKQSETRLNRILKSIPKIEEGIGLHD